MTTTDRMPDLNSRREITDRLGETVILGNAIEAGALSAIAQIVAGAAGTSEAKVPFTMTAISDISWYNASFGVWAVYFDMDATANLSASGGTVINSRLASAATALAAFGTNAGGLLNIQVFTATGAYTPTAGTVSIIVEAVGGGGGGGGCGAPGVGTSAAGGGGAGALAIGRITSGFSGVTVTIGAGGAGGAAGANNGTAGGATTFGSVLSAGGGSGGVAVPAGGGLPRAAGGGAGGAASGSSSLMGITGEQGGLGYAYNNFILFSGEGGSTLYGGGGTQVNTTSNGNAGAGKGSGGSGGGTGSVAAAGGAGTDGICLIYEYNT